jgi:hypothetical protein
LYRFADARNGEYHSVAADCEADSVELLGKELFIIYY